MGSVVDTGGACETLRGRGRAHARRRAVRVCAGADSRTRRRRVEECLFALAASLSAVELRRICQRRAVGRHEDGSGINGKRAI
jgi:hypothetical protein